MPRSPTILRLCHLANAAYRVGNRDVEDAKAALPKGPQVAEAFEKINAKLHRVDLPIKGSSLTIGKSLAFDPAKEKFVDDEAANKLITRVYRPPFVVPDTVVSASAKPSRCWGEGGRYSNAI